jgi:hypothetical protein
MGKKGRKNNRTGKDESCDPVSRVFAELGLKQSEWEVRVDYTKGILTGGRGTVVQVIHLPTGRKKKLSAVSSTKKAAHQKTADVLRQCLIELRKR